eukprot:12406-Heterococcus_DN1.PRE.4
MLYNVLVVVVVCLATATAFVSSSIHHQRSLTCSELKSKPNAASYSTLRMVAAAQVDAFPYSSVLPFLKEHIQPSDQLLVLGARNDLPLRLSADGYGTRDTRSFILVVDSDADVLSAAKAAAEADAACAANIAAGHLVFELKADMTAMDDLEQDRWVKPN